MDDMDDMQKLDDMLSAAPGCVGALCKLLGGGADPDAQVRGWRLIHLYARDGEKEMVEALLEYGADADVQKEDGWTPLMLSIYNEHYEIAQLLAGYADLAKKNLAGQGLDDFVEELPYGDSRARFADLLAGERSRREKMALGECVGDGHAGRRPGM